MSDDATSLYRHFAADGSLLYVGISLSWPARTKAHVRGSRWFEQVAKVEIERFPTRTEALDAERAAIKREKPEFNVVHNNVTKAERKREFYKDLPALDDVSCRFLSTSERRRVARQREAQIATLVPMRVVPKRGGSRLDKCDYRIGDIRGSLALVGPSLIYSGNNISVMVAHGEPGAAGKLTEVILGPLAAGVPDWAHSVATVMTIDFANALTMDEARSKRTEIVERLRKYIPTVEAFDSDISLASANASMFPSAQSRKILNDMASERGASS